MPQETAFIQREDLDQVTQRYHVNQRKKQRSRRGTRHRGALDFTSLAAEGNRFINQVAGEIGCDRATAARITRAVLHALRDRLPPDDSIEFAQGLPLVLKGVWLDQYDLSATPVRARGVNEFLQLVEDRAHFTLMLDFPTTRHTAYAVRAVFRVLEDTVDMGQLDNVKMILGHEISSFLEYTGRY